MAYDPAYHHSWYERNKERLLARQKERLRDPVVRSAKTLRDGQRKIERKKTDVCFRLAGNLRSRLNDAVKNEWKTGSAVRDLGCTIPELKAHLERLFQPGMSWDNYGPKGWHIDHVKPLAKFDLTDPRQLRAACHYTNLQPLWAEDNLKKSGN